MNKTSFVVLLISLFATSSYAKDLARSKRQLQVYYMCNGGVSQYPCNNYNNCNNNNNCNYGNYGSSMIIPTSFYNSNMNCNTGCSNLNCNQYNGQYINGQYVAYTVGSNAYSPCASSCCSSNSFNNNNNNNNIYNPYNQINTFQNIGNGVNFGSSNDNLPFAAKSFTGTYSNGMYLCGGSEPSGGVCQNNGVCPGGHSCVAGNVCCRCPVGASAGNCRVNDDCSAGYTCSGTGSCCPSQIISTTELVECINGKCIDGQTCGMGNLCYPNGYF